MEPLYTQARNLGRRGNRNRKRRRDGDDADGDDGKRIIIFLFQVKLWQTVMLSIEKM